MRQFTPYEYNHLLKHGLDPNSIPENDSTPVEYLTGHVEFAGRDWYITPDALIPRIETEELLEHAVTSARDRAPQLPPTQPLTWIEVGTGSAALGLSFWLELQKLGIKQNSFMSDISAEALEVARVNAKAVGADSSIIVSDLFNDIPATQKFDIVLANLPYIPTDRIAYLDSSVKDHEPPVALDGGPEGLTLISKLLQQLPERLTPTGCAWLEIDYTHTINELKQNPALEKALSLLEFTSHFDEFQRQRFWEVTLR